MSEIMARPRRALETLRAQIAPGATDEELAYFGKVCERLGLDYFAGHVVLIGRYDRRVRGTVHRPQLTIEGRREIAERTGQYDGMTGPEWCGPRDANGQLVWREVWDQDDYPYAARVFVYRKDRTYPANGTVKWSEFAQYVDAERTRLMPQWAQMPSHMLAKTAESLALRRAFTQVSAALAVVGGDDLEPEPVAADDETGEIAGVADDTRNRNDPDKKLGLPAPGTSGSAAAAGTATQTGPLTREQIDQMRRQALTGRYRGGSAPIPPPPTPDADEPTPPDVTDDQPESLAEPSYRYEHDDDGRPFQ